MANPAHLSWLAPTGNTLSSQDGRAIELWELNHAPQRKILSAWARHFRSHYCDDAQIDVLRAGTAHASRRDYLLGLKFPDAKLKPGPSIRAGDFAEILVADYVEYLLGYWVPRTRYADKAVRNESKKGSDILGFKMRRAGRASPDDTLLVFEAKAQLSGRKARAVLQEAIEHSAKDEVRRAESLNAAKQRLLDLGDLDGVNRIARFQDLAGNPYRSKWGAAALVTGEVLDHGVLGASDATSHPGRQSLTLIVISGPKLMKLVHRLYKRAAHEA